ncbi:hypothetical protein ADUPG1_009160 [Aduncisulcus paluster]|uniref:Recombination activating protein 2 n=1 Tax=Aduncisulcus paluster TaxID=2918883 RepID=A0ABQ5KUK4_9EUKA|nr:hypothetical protein ADUPG1_009160 [Aduncisulcus paluster]
MSTNLEKLSRTAPTNISSSDGRYQVLVPKIDFKKDVYFFLVNEHKMLALDSPIVFSQLILITEISHVAFVAASSTICDEHPGFAYYEDTGSQIKIFDLERRSTQKPINVSYEINSIAVDSRDNIIVSTIPKGSSGYLYVFKANGSKRKTIECCVSSSSPISVNYKRNMFAYSSRDSSMTYIVSSDMNPIAQVEGMLGGFSSCGKYLWTSSQEHECPVVFSVSDDSTWRMCKICEDGNPTSCSLIGGRLGYYHTSQCPVFFNMDPEDEELEEELIEIPPESVFYPLCSEANLYLLYFWDEGMYKAPIVAEISADTCKLEQTMLIEDAIPLLVTEDTSRSEDSTREDSDSPQRDGAPMEEVEESSYGSQIVAPNKSLPPKETKDGCSCFIDTSRSEDSTREDSDSPQRDGAPMEEVEESSYGSQIVAPNKSLPPKETKDGCSCFIV